jgi:hypothetical protein
MRACEESLPLTPDERFRALAGLLAAGVRRLRRGSSLPPDPGPQAEPNNLPESRRDGLAVCGETRLTVQTG